MKILLLFLLFISCFADLCWFPTKSYFLKCELPGLIGNSECLEERENLVKQGCENVVLDFQICRKDFQKFCGETRFFGKCIKKEADKFQKGCTNTETMKLLRKIAKKNDDSQEKPSHHDEFERPSYYPERNHVFKSHKENKRFHKKGLDCFHAVAFFVFSIISLFGVIWVVRERNRRAAIRRARKTNGQKLGVWSTGLFGTWDSFAPDWKTCLPSFFFPCFQSAINHAELQDRDCHCADVIFNVFKVQTQTNCYRDRQEIRARFDIPKDGFEDCLAAVCCTPCAIAQNTREIDIRTGMSQGNSASKAVKLADCWVPETPTKEILV